jgi:hypothetical protein
MGNPESEVLKIAFAAAKVWNERSTVLVMGGVVIEFAALLIFSKDMPRREKIALFFGNVLVIVGVGGEWIFGGREADAASTLQQMSDQKVAALQREQEADHKTAAQAAAYAASLGVTVEKLPDLVNGKLAIVNRQYAVLKIGVDAETKRDTALISQFDKDKKTFDTARNDALTSAGKAEAAVATINRAEADIAAALNSVQDMRQRVIAMTTPRTIDNSHFTAMVEALKKFPKTPVELSLTRDPESGELLVRVSDAFIAAGWDIKPCQGSGFGLHSSARPTLPNLCELTGRGVQVSVAQEDQKALAPAGDAFLGAIRDAGIFASPALVSDKLPDGKPNPDAVTHGVLHVMIGVKP